jgi:hypothetical protein
MLRRWIDTSRDQASQAGLDTGGEGAEVADALDFVVGELDAEVIFEAAEQLEGLQAVDAELLEEVVVGREGIRGNLEMLGGEVQHFLRGLVDRAHR